MDIITITIIGNPPLVVHQPGQAANTPSHLMLCSAIPAIKEAIASAPQGDGRTKEEMCQQIIVAIPAMANSMSDLVVYLEGICLKNTSEVEKLWKKIARILWIYNKDRHGDQIWSRIVLVSHGQQTVFNESPPPE